MILRISLTKKPGALFFSNTNLHCKDSLFRPKSYSGLFNCSCGSLQMVLTCLFFSVRDFSQLRLVNGVFFSVNGFFFSKEK